MTCEGRRGIPIQKTPRICEVNPYICRMTPARFKVEQPCTSQMVFEPHPRSCTCCEATLYKGRVEDSDSETDSSEEENTKNKSNKKSATKKKNKWNFGTKKSKKRKRYEEEQVALMRETKRREKFVTACCEGLLLTPCGSAGSYSEDQGEGKEQANFYLKCKCSPMSKATQNEDCCKKQDQRSQWHGDFPCKCRDCEYSDIQDPVSSCVDRGINRGKVCYCKQENEHCSSIEHPVCQSSPCDDHPNTRHNGAFINEEQPFKKKIGRNSRPCKDRKRKQFCCCSRALTRNTMEEIDVDLFHAVNRVLQLQDEGRCGGDSDLFNATIRMNALLKDHVIKKLPSNQACNYVSSTRVCEDGPRIEDYFDDSISAQEALIEAFMKILVLQKQERSNPGLKVDSAIGDFRRKMELFVRKGIQQQSLFVPQMFSTSQQSSPIPRNFSLRSTNQNSSCAPTHPSNFRNNLQPLPCADGRQMSQFARVDTGYNPSLLSGPWAQKSHISNQSGVPEDDQSGHICIPKQVLWDANDPTSSKLCVTLTFHKFNAYPTQDQCCAPQKDGTATANSLPTNTSNEPMRAHGPTLESNDKDASLKNHPNQSLPAPPPETQEPNFRGAQIREEPGPGRRARKENAGQYLRATNENHRRLADFSTGPLSNWDQHQRRSYIKGDSMEQFRSSEESDCKAGRCALRGFNKKVKINSHAPAGGQLPNSLSREDGTLGPQGAATTTTNEELCMMMDRIKSLQRELKKYSNPE